MAKNILAEITISTHHGPIRGTECISIYNDKYYSFEGIPYAQPPLANLRFRAPVPIKAWKNVLNCTAKPSKPMQKNQETNEIEGDENCLYLNVFVKKLKSAKPLPVMVFLFGGGFEKGDPTRDYHGPDYFMMKDVVLVTIGYRVNVFGFLSLNNSALDIPGNAGLKDQLLGLKWFAHNASNFNGDPNNITLFGESAGAASTHYLMLTPLAKGLFHKAILQSGNVYCTWAQSTLPNLAYRLAQANGYDGPHVDAEILAYLQQLSATALMRPCLPTKQETLNDCIFTFGPVVEPFNSENCIIPQEPDALMATAWSNKIPIMLGGTSYEGLFMYARVQAAPFLINELRSNTEHALPLELKRKHSLGQQKQLGAKVLQAHFADKAVCMDNLLNYCELASYKIFWHPILRTIRARLRYAEAATFLYRFDFASPDFNHQRIKYCGKQVLQKGVAHVDDHSYLFYGNFSWKLQQQTREFRTIERMIEIWTTFATNSNPNCKQIVDAAVGASAWLPLADDGAAFKCLNIGDELRVIDLPEMNKLQIWESLYKQEK